MKNKLSNDKISISLDYSPKLSSLVYFSDLYKNKKKNSGYVIIGIKDKDTQYIINAKKEASYKNLFSFFNGEKSIKQIAALGYGQENELLRLINDFRNKGFFEDYKPINSGFNEAEQLSIHILKCKFTVLITSQDYVLVLYCYLKLL